MTVEKQASQGGRFKGKKRWVVGATVLASAALLPQAGNFLSTPSEDAGTQQIEQVEPVPDFGFSTDPARDTQPSVAPYIAETPPSHQAFESGQPLYYAPDMTEPAESTSPMAPFSSPRFTRSQLSDDQSQTTQPLTVRSMAPMALTDSPEVGTMSDAASEPPASAGGDAFAVEEYAVAQPGAETGTEPVSETSDPDEPFQTVTVFYGTDRLADTVLEAATPHSFWMKCTVAAMFVTVLIGLWANRKLKRGMATAIMGVSVLVSALLAVVTIIAKHQADTIGTGIGPRYGNDRGELVVGTCDVSIPKEHQVGKIESPSLTHMEFVANPEQHVTLMRVEQQPLDLFRDQLNERLAQSDRREAFVFVHGYNVTFEAAAQRTAQLAHDLQFDGAPIFYSWPSQGGLLKYTIDETNVRWTVAHLKQFLATIAETENAESVHLIAHSMGNRALTDALKDLAYQSPESQPMFDEVLLTAPDVDAALFQHELAPAIVKTAKRVTLYASSNDEALVMSKKLHGYPRAGDSGHALIIVPGIDTVDVSSVDTSLVGHTYYGDNDTVIADMIELIHNSYPPDNRQWLHAKLRDLDQEVYWVLNYSDTIMR